MEEMNDDDDDSDDEDDDFDVNQIEPKGFYATTQRQIRNGFILFWRSVILFY